MPRIPARTEPYESPARQQRHFKAKRDQALKALGKASYVNGSHFAILFVNARGIPESYGTPLFRDKLSVWFNDSVTREAIQLVRHDQRKNSGDDQQAGPAPSITDRTITSSPESSSSRLDNLQYPAPPTPVTPSFPPSGPPQSHSRQAEYPVTPAVSPQQARRIVRSIDHDTNVEQSELPYVELFHRIQQNTVKTICKCWIKVIEPKKQTRFPYQGEDQTKPDWWPRHIRHKEPDHLLMHERQGVMLAILRKAIRRNQGEERPSPSALTVAKLEMGTAEMTVHISPDKHELLKELYSLAKEEESKWIPRSVPETPSRSSTNNDSDESSSQEAFTYHSPHLAMPPSIPSALPRRDSVESENDLSASPEMTWRPRTTIGRTNQLLPLDRSAVRFHPYYTSTSSDFIGTVNTTRADWIPQPSPNITSFGTRVTLILPS